MFISFSDYIFIFFPVFFSSLRLLFLEYFIIKWKYFWYVFVSVCKAVAAKHHTNVYIVVVVIVGVHNLFPCRMNWNKKPETQISSHTHTSQRTHRIALLCTTRLTTGELDIRLFDLRLQLLVNLMLTTSIFTWHITWSVCRLLKLMSIKVKRKSPTCVRFKAIASLHLLLTSTSSNECGDKCTPAYPFLLSHIELTNLSWI